MQFAATHCAFTSRYKKTQRLLYLGTTLSSVIARDLTWGAGLGLLSASSKKESARPTALSDLDQAKTIVIETSGELKKKRDDVMI